MARRESEYADRVGPEPARDQPLSPIEEPVHVGQISARGPQDEPQGRPGFLIRFAKVGPYRGSAHVHRIAPHLTVDGSTRPVAAQEQMKNNSQNFAFGG